MANFSLTQTKRHCRWQILDSLKLRDFADNNFKSYENGSKFFQGIEKTLGKGEMACYKQFLLFPRCFQKACNADT